MILAPFHGCADAEARHERMPPGRSFSHVEFALLRRTRRAYSGVMGVAWIPITIVAALSQTARNALQRSLKGRLSTNGAAFTRFVFGLPFACVYLGLVVATGVTSWPTPHGVFWAWLVAASLSQIAATSLLIHVMAARNFATAVAYAKTEVAQAAAFEIIFLGATVTWLGAAGVVLATISVMLMSVSRSAHPLRTLLVGWMEPSAPFGLLAG